MGDSPCDHSNVSSRQNDSTLDEYLLPNLDSHYTLPLDPASSKNHYKTLGQSFAMNRAVRGNTVAIIGEST